MNDTLIQQRQQYLYPTKVPYYQKPIHLVKAKGSLVWDADGNEYLDAVGGIVCLSVGHNHPRIKAKLMEMVENDAIQHTTFLYLSEFMPDLAEKIAKQAPGDLEKCYITNSGSEANEMAVMTARAATGEQMVVSLRHGYHGGTGTPMGLCGHSTWKMPNQPQTNTVHAVAPYCYRCPFGKTKGSCALECAEDVKNTIETATSGKIAAFIAEPIMGVGGFIDAPVEYHKRVYDIVKEKGGLYISDEVQTGVGRTGEHFFAIEDAGFTPDMITMAKGIGNGAPVGAVVAKGELADALKGKLHFNTFGGDPYQAMQAAEVIDIIEDENLIENAKQMGEYLHEGFAQMKNEFELIGDVRGRGLLVGLELVTCRENKTPAIAETAQIMELAKDNGLLIGKGSLLGNVIRIAPSLAITREECDKLLDIMRQSFTQQAQ